MRDPHIGIGPSHSTTSTFTKTGLVFGSPFATPVLHRNIIWFIIVSSFLLRAFKVLFKDTSAQEAVYAILQDGSADKLGAGPRNPP